MVAYHHRLFRSLVACALLLLGAVALSDALAQRPVPQPLPSPNAPKNENVPQGLDGPPPTVEQRKLKIEAENQKVLREQVLQLYNMVAELKDDVDRTNANDTLSVSFVKKAQAIEKLAKNIKDRAKH